MKHVFGRTGGPKCRESNRPATLADVEAYSANPQAAIADRHETIDAHHGRLETRRCAVVHDIVWLCADACDPDQPAMLGLATIVRIEAELERDGKIARSGRYQLSSARLFAARAA